MNIFKINSNEIYDWDNKKMTYFQYDGDPDATSTYFWNYAQTYTLIGNTPVTTRTSTSVTIKVDSILSSSFAIPSGKTLIIDSGVTLKVSEIGTLLNEGTITNNGTFDTRVGTFTNTDGTVNNNSSWLCFYGFVKIITKDGLKEIKDLKRGELVLTNDGYQPLARLVYSPNFREYRGKQQMVKIPKDFFTKNIPNEDIYTTDTHPLSVKVLSEKEDTDFEYLHLFVKELIGLNNDDKKIKYEYLEEEKNMYNLVFDKHYELNIGGIKFLSHHPNHNNGNLRLSNGDEIDPNNRSKKVYADKKGIYFKRITLTKLLKDKPEQMSDKEYIVSLIQF